MKNKLIVIGYKPYTGFSERTCYLNISREEAVKRYLKDNPFADFKDLVTENMVDEFEFGDEFLTTSAYPK